MERPDSLDKNSGNAPKRLFGVHMKEIPLTRGKVALVDDADYERISQFKWELMITSGLSYARRRYRDDMDVIRTQLMHRLILGDEARQIDHVDGDGLNNQRANLRPASHRLNQGNTRLSRKNTSGYRGVTYNRECRKWAVMITIGNRRTYLGMYQDAKTAAAIYDAAATKWFGEFARLNIPDAQHALPSDVALKVDKAIRAASLNDVTKTYKRAAVDDDEYV